MKTQKVQTIAALSAAFVALSAPTASAFSLGKTLGIQKPIEKLGDFGNKHANKAGDWFAEQSGAAGKAREAKAAMTSVENAADKGASAAAQAEITAKQAELAAKQAEITAREHELLAKELNAKFKVLGEKAESIAANLDRAISLIMWPASGLLTALAAWVVRLACKPEKDANLRTQAIPAEI